MAHAHAFYRSPIVRWSMVAAGAFCAVFLSPFVSSAWHTVPSLLWIHRLLPWWFMAGLFAVYALLLIWGRIEAVIVAEFGGCFMWGVELIALAATTPGRSRNPLFFAAVFLVVVLHFAAGRLAVIQRETA